MIGYVYDVVVVVVVVVVVEPFVYFRVLLKCNNYY